MTKLIKKITTYLLIIIAVLGNTGWISSVKIKDVKKEGMSKNFGSTFNEELQYKPAEKNLERNSEILSLKRPTPSLSYRNYYGQKIPNEIPQSGQVALLINSTSSSSVVMAVTNFDYITDQNHTIINEIRDINIDIVEPKGFLARNLNEEWKGDIDFYSNYSDHSRKI